MEKPLTAYVRCIIDAEGFELDAVETREAVNQLNAYDDLLAACEAMLACTDYYCITTDECRRAIELAKAAISKARPEPTSRPDVSC